MTVGCNSPNHRTSFLLRVTLAVSGLIDAFPVRDTSQSVMSARKSPGFSWGMARPAPSMTVGEACG